VAAAPADETLAKAQVQATMQSARSIEALADAEAAPARLGEARLRYEQVMKDGDAMEKLAARNSLGVVLLKQGNTKEALATLQQIDLAAAPPAQAFVFQTNLARAYETAGQGGPALESYKAALSRQPGFPAAQEGAFRLLRDRTPRAPAEAIGLIDLLARGGESRAAAHRTRDLLLAWDGDAGAALLPSLATQYAAARVRPPEFTDREWPLLARATSPPLRAALDQLRLVYQDDLAATSSSPDPAVLSAWHEPRARAEAMAALLRFLGGVQEAGERPREALARFWMAWLLARDPEDAVATLAVLEAQPDLPDESTRILETLITTLFQSKGQAYAREDWPRIMRLHVILAGLFEKQGRWGPEFEPATALFQWQHAARAAAAARERDPGQAPAPGIHQSLAGCYRRLGRTGEAWGEYVTAAEMFLAARRPEDAREALAEARALGWSPPSAQERERFAALQEVVEGRAH
jgi:tetratricopeptide (TPR) repeat protein